jgi:hypothetical protein
MIRKLFAILATAAIVAALLVACRKAPTPVDTRSAADASIPAFDHDKLMAAASECGGTGVGIAQDATLQCIAAAYGLSTPVGGTGVGIAQDATLQAIYAALADGGAGGGTKLPDAGTGGIWYQNDAGGVSGAAACGAGQLLGYGASGIPICAAVANLTLFNGATSITGGVTNALALANGTGTPSTTSGGGAVYEDQGIFTHIGQGGMIYEVAPPGAGTQNSQKGVWFDRCNFAEILGGARTTIITLPPIASGRTQHITADVVCTDTVAPSSSGGATVAGTFINTAGTVSQLGSTTSIDNANFGSAPSLTVSGTSILVQATPNAEEITDCQACAHVNYD